MTFQESGLVVEVASSNKPNDASIRQRANVGDWVAGIASAEDITDEPHGRGSSLATQPVDADVGFDAALWLLHLALAGMTGHGILAVVGKLSVKPLMQRRHELGVGRGVTQFGAILEVGVSNVDLPRTSCLQFGQAGHLLTMNASRPRKIALEELVSNLPQMLSRQTDLGNVVDVFDHHLLNTALGRLGENVGRRSQIEGHDVFATSRNVCLSLRLRHGGLVGAVVHAGVIHDLGMGAARKSQQDKQSGVAFQNRTP